MTDSPADVQPDVQREAPEGWVPFGTHADHVPTPNLVFSYEIDETGMPLWERPGDLRAEIGALVEAWRDAVNQHESDAMDDMSVATRACIADMERLFGIQ